MKENEDFRRLITDANPLEGHRPPPRRGRPPKSTTHCPSGHELTPENTYQSKSRGYVRLQCKTCTREANARWKEKNPERYKELQQRRNKTKTWTPELADKNRWWRLKKNYGLSREQFEEIWEGQGGRCAICAEVLRLRQPRSENGPAMSTDTAVVDHCHATKTVRGILCTRCNTSLGYMKDESALFDKASEYLKRHGR